MVASTINGCRVHVQQTNGSKDTTLQPFEKTDEEEPVGVALSSKRFFGLVGKTLKGCG